MFGDRGEQHKLAQTANSSSQKGSGDATRIDLIVEGTNLLPIRTVHRFFSPTTTRFVGGNCVERMAPHCDSDSALQTVLCDPPIGIGTASRHYMETRRQCVKSGQNNEPPRRRDAEKRPSVVFPLRSLRPGGCQIRSIAEVDQVGEVFAGVIEEVEDFTDDVEEVVVAAAAEEQVDAQSPGKVVV